MNRHMRRVSEMKNKNKIHNLTFNKNLCDQIRKPNEELTITLRT